jgi:hypothetical protein
MNRNGNDGASENRAGWSERQIAELSLLLPAWQVAELERLARARGLSIGQLIRRLIGDYLASRNGPGSLSAGA